MASRRQLLAGIAATATAPVTAAVAAPVLVGCGSGPRPATPDAMDSVTLLTAFGTTPRECYGWVTDGMGYFREAGIHATIKPGAPSDTNLKTLASGKAQFAIIDFVSAVRGMTSAWPDYRVVAAIQQSTLLSMITLADRQITRPDDLAHRTLGTAAAAATQTLFPTYARLARFDPTGVHIVNFAADRLPTALASGAIDAMGAYLVDTPGVEKVSGGRPAVVLPYATYLTDLYGSVLITTTKLTRTRPDLVRRFTSALQKGVRYAVDQPADAGRVAHRSMAILDADIVAKTMTLMRPYVSDGVLDAARVMRGITVLQAAGLAAQGLTPERLVDFTLMPQEAR